MGDPAGIGPEIIVKSLSQINSSSHSRLVVIGEWWLLQKTAQNLNVSLNFVESKSPVAHGVAVHSLNAISQKELKLACVSAQAGKSSYLYFEKAIERCLNQEFSGLITAPICKESLVLAGYRYRGHTDILEQQTGFETVMSILHPKVSIALVTDHLPLRQAIDAITPNRLTKVIELLHQLLKKQGIESPKIAIAGINPHAGETGILGTEEQIILIPTLQKLKHLNLLGPISADTLFLRAFRGEFHGVVAMYHDQGFIPIKTVDFAHGVNCTLGIPFVRTSPDHGTAFEIAGQGIADETSMLESLNWAFALAKH